MNNNADANAAAGCIMEIDSFISEKIFDLIFKDLITEESQDPFKNISSILVFVMSSLFAIQMRKYLKTDIGEEHQDKIFEEITNSFLEKSRGFYYELKAIDEEENKTNQG